MDGVASVCFRVAAVPLDLAVEGRSVDLLSMRFIAKAQLTRWIVSPVQGEM
jgi:hypothetical protein